MKRSLNGLFVYQAVVYAAGLLLATGIVSDWGRWYSSSTAYRSQTDAFLEGQLPVSHDVRDLKFDHTWSEEGVHHVWGLGIPVWRMPWELLARLFGQEGFPDRIAFGLFALLVSFVVLKVWLHPEDGNPGWEDGREGLGWSLVTGFGGGFVVLLLFPPFLTLLQTRSAVWEEAVSYEYLFAILLVTLLVAFDRKPSRFRLFGMCLLAGVGGLIRPTLVFYGFATLVIASLVWIWRKRPTGSGGHTGFVGRWRATLSPVMIAGLLFCIGGGVLWWTNLVRFGDGFEFGHKLNVQTLYGSMYATRFDDPFQEVPIVEAGRELFGAIFLDRNFNGANFYQDNIFPGQSDVPRWREFYFRTFDLSFLPLILIGWGVAGMLLWRSWQRRGAFSECDSRECLSRAGVLGAWSLLSIVPLLGFYLYAPVISSRYMMDLAPAFAAAIVGVWIWAAGRLTSRWSRIVACIILCAWVGMELFLSKAVYGGPRSLSWDELEDLRQRQGGSEPAAVVGSRVQLGDEPVGIPFDRGGWDQKTGEIKPTVILFVQDAEFLELEVVRGEHAVIEPNPEDIRAKVGLEWLQRESITETERGWLIRFSGPEQARWRTGLQAAFLATVPNQFLAERSTPWILKSVRWRDAVE